LANRLKIKPSLRSGRTLLVLHVFVKKTQTTPRRAIETALKRLEEST